MRTRTLVKIGWAISLVLVAASVGTAREEGSGDALWQPASPETRVVPAEMVRVRPEAARTFRMDVGRMEAALFSAPSTSDPVPPAPGDGTLVSLPLADGTVAPFRAVEDPILDAATAAAHPDLRTYAVVREGDPSTWGRVTWTTTGLHALVLTPEGASRVDPLYVGDRTVHAVYYRRDAAADEGFVCHTLASRALQAPGGPPRVTIGGTLHAYDLAITTTPGYTAWAVTNAGSALNAVTTTVNNANVVLQRDVTIRFNLVVDADLFYTTASPPPYTIDFSSDPAISAMLQGIHDAITAEITSAGFDLGFCFDGTTDNGGVSWGSVCTDSDKGRLYVSHSDPGGAVFLTRFMHEGGHQFGAGHTWSSGTFDAGQFAPASAFEPGEGSTIMSYGHSFGTDHIPGSNREDYYHGGSIQEIATFVAGSACDAETATGNAPPTANAGPDFTIPKQTPFALAGVGADADDPAGNLTYAWEEMDPASAQVALTKLDDGVIPLFRSFRPVAAGFSRLFPEASVLLNNQRFPGTTTYGVLGQQLPRVARGDGAMDFRLTVRDNRAGSATMTGGVNQDDMKVVVDTASGPFVVTAPNGGETWDLSLPQTVTWNVAGTSGAPVNAANVNGRLSLDGGATWPIFLFVGAPNNGSRGVVLDCSMRTTQARVKVEATGNLFFDVSDANFTIADLTPPVVTATVTRTLFYPPRGAFLPPGLVTSAVDNCDPPGSLTSTVTVYSDEPNGPGPFTPDALMSGGTLYLRAERDITKDGRVYLIVVKYTDTAGRTGFACTTVVVPLAGTVAATTNVLWQASSAQATCNGPGGPVVPPGFVQILP